ncbi:hypothetical protein [Gracilimonas tropica]|uniref:hypothetical protein n=1 Tax=Gracilimonas tropica TaxID=454600 RepID=UPI00037B118C|nr:hypothetical protein [Gracilimonas tropica]
MKHFKTLFISTVIGTGMLLSACVKTVNHSSTTYVRDLAQSDVFTVLPENGSNISVYDKTDDIKGEYLELATVSVEVEATGDQADKEALISKLKAEALVLGGNGILVMEDSGLKEGSVQKFRMKGIAIFTLDEIPGERQEPFALLPS